MSNVHHMLEKVARAMCAADGLDPDEHIVGGQATGFEDFGPLWQAEQRSEGQLGITDYVRQARVAIQALLEPDEGMIREMLAVEWPATFRTHLRHPDAGPVSAQETERLIEREKRRVQAMLKPLLGDEG